MLSRYDTAQSSWVDTSTMKRYDTSQKAWVDIGSAKVYDTSQQAWVEKLYKYLTVTGYTNGSGNARCTVTENERRASIYMGHQGDAIRFVISNPKVKAEGTKLKFTFENTYGKPRLEVECRTEGYAYYWSPIYYSTTEVEFVQNGSLGNALIGEIAFTIKCEQHDGLYSYSSCVLKDIELGGVKYKFPQVTM